MLPLLLPLAGTRGILGVALSGAGPGVLLVVDAEASLDDIAARIRQSAADPALEIIETTIGCGARQVCPASVQHAPESRLNQSV